MADREDFEALLRTLETMPKEKVYRPRIPVGALSQESEMLVDWVQDDRDKFLAVKFDWNLVMSLSERIGAMRYAEARWSNTRLRQKDAQKEWEAIRAKGYDTREELFAAMDLAFDGDEDLMQRLSELREGESHADMISDVGASAELCREQQPLMEEIGFDMAIVDEAAELADQMARLLGEADADRLKDSPERDIRDRAYTYLDQAVRKIRKCGKYVNRKDPERLKGYMSDYIKSRNRRSRKSAEMPENDLG